MNRLLLFGLVLALATPSSAFSHSREKRVGKQHQDAEKHLRRILELLKDYLKEPETKKALIASADDDNADNNAHKRDYEEWWDVLYGLSDADLDKISLDMSSVIDFGDAEIQGEDPYVKAIFEMDEWTKEHDHHLNDPAWLMDHGSSKRGLNIRARLWGTTIPYTDNFGPAAKKVLQSVIGLFAKETCLKFVIRTTETDYIHFDKDGQGCSSNVGKIGGRQSISIEPGCDTEGTVIHEIFHALGFEHEQSRLDRSRFIMMVWKLIHEGSIVNYIIELTKYINTFDESSILQYGVEGGEMKLVAHPELAFLTSMLRIWSHYDKQEIVKAYKCDSNCPASLVCKNMGFPRSTVEEPICKCSCPPGLKGATCTETDGDADCGGIITLQNGQTQIITAPGYASGSYTPGKKCIWLIMGVGPHARIKIKITEFNIYSSSAGGDSRSCIHYFAPHYNLLAQAAKHECGKPTVPKIYLKEQTKEDTNLMMIEFNTMKNAGTGATSGKIGFKLYASAQLSKCEQYQNPCKNMGLCTDVDSSDYTCACKEGYSGKNCNTVKADATVTCNFETDIQGHCFLKNDPSLLPNQMHGVHALYTTKAKQGVIFGAMYVDTTKPSSTWITKLKSTPTFETGRRCLMADIFVADAKIEVYLVDGSTTTPLVTITTTSNAWKNYPFSIPDLHGKTIVMKGSSVVYYGQIGIDNIRLSPKDCASVDDCNPNPCLNKGTCAKTPSGSNKFTCSCVDGYSGDKCQTAPDYCNPNPCLNKGTCAKTPSGSNKFTCSCVDGYSGDKCQTAPDDCNPNPCLNKGTCAKTPSGSNKFTCSCVDGYSGDKCQTAPAPGSCNPNTEFKCTNGECITKSWKCDNFADCKDQTDEIGCRTCTAAEWTCASGFCIDSSWKCDSYVDCYDKSDEVNDQCPTDHCSPNPCQNGGACTNTASGSNQFTCSCATGYKGDKCQTVDHCKPNPCQNGGACTNTASGSNQFTCSCATGYKGDKCQTVDNCSPNPCQNGGGCTNTASGFTCSCVGGFTGDKCQTASVDHCSPNPCQNGGGCTNSASGFTCSCTGGYTGNTCQTAPATASCDSALEFTCTDGQCIEIGWKCDDYVDCTDQSDEAGCRACTTNEWTCTSGFCIDKTWKCDGDEDCFDKSDEAQCPSTRSNVRLRGKGTSKSSITANTSLRERLRSLLRSSDLSNDRSSQMASLKDELLKALKPRQRR